MGRLAFTARRPGAFAKAQTLRFQIEAAATPPSSNFVRPIILSSATVSIGAQTVACKLALGAACGCDETIGRPAPCVAGRPVKRVVVASSLARQLGACPALQEMLVGTWPAADTHTCLARLRPAAEFAAAAAAEVEAVV